jgi:uncharacterized protein involved in outer membrane biogenesis
MKKHHKKLLLTTLLGWLAVVCIAWLWFVLPIVLRNFASEKLGSALKREASIRRITINPFRLVVGIEGLTLSEADGRPFVMVDGARANIQLSSLWRGLVIHDLELRNPHLRIVREDADGFNFTDMIPPPTTEPVVEEESEPTAIYIGQVSIKGLHVLVDDRLMTTQHVLRGFDLSATDISSEDLAAKLDVSAFLNSAKLAISATVDMPNADVVLGLEDCDVTHYLAYLPLPRIPAFP